jgi:hypothetical protein
MSIKVTKRGFCCLQNFIESNIESMPAISKGSRPFGRLVRSD